MLHPTPSLSCTRWFSLLTNLKGTYMWACSSFEPKQPPMNSKFSSYMLLSFMYLTHVIVSFVFRLSVFICISKRKEAATIPTGLWISIYRMWCWRKWLHFRAKCMLLILLFSFLNSFQHINTDKMTCTFFFVAFESVRRFHQTCNSKHKWGWGKG